MKVLYKKCGRGIRQTIWLFETPDEAKELMMSVITTTSYNILMGYKGNITMSFSFDERHWGRLDHSFMSRMFNDYYWSLPEHFSEEEVTQYMYTFEEDAPIKRCT